MGGTHNIYPFKKYTKPEFITKMLLTPHPHPHPPHTTAQKTVLNIELGSMQNELKQIE